jgi:hypothetical protein
MITVNLVLKMGTMRKGQYTEWDYIEMEFEQPGDPDACDNLNDWLNTHADPICNYAELKLQSNTLKHDGFLLGTFRKVKLKDKGYRWILTD